MRCVKVLWKDSTTPQEVGWVAAEEALDWATDPVVLCESVGLLVYEGPDHICLYQSRHPEEFMAPLKIPCSCIVRWAELVETGVAPGPAAPAAAA